MTTPADEAVNNLNPPEPDKGEEIKYAFVVGVKNNGQFVFDVHGDSIGLIELLGLKEYADRRIQGIFDDNHGTGDAISMQNYRLLSQLVQAVAPQQAPEPAPEVSTTVETEQNDAPEVTE